MKDPERETWIVACHHSNRMSKFTRIPINLAGFELLFDRCRSMLELWLPARVLAGRDWGSIT